MHWRLCGLYLFPIWSVTSTLHSLIFRSSHPCKLPGLTTSPLQLLLLLTVTPLLACAVHHSLSFADKEFPSCIVESSALTGWFHDGLESRRWSVQHVPGSTQYTNLDKTSNSSSFCGCFQTVCSMILSIRTSSFQQCTMQWYLAASFFLSHLEWDEVSLSRGRCFTTSAESGCFSRERHLLHAHDN